MKTNKAEFIARVAYIVGKYNFGYSLDENPKTNQLNFLSVDNEEHYCGFYINMKKVEFWINDEKETRYIYPEENEEECLRMLKYALTLDFEAFLTAIFLAAIFPITKLIFICNRIVGKILKKL